MADRKPDQAHTVLYAYAGARKLDPETAKLGNFWPEFVRTYDQLDAAVGRLDAALKALDRGRFRHTELGDMTTRLVMEIDDYHELRGNLTGEYPGPRVIMIDTPSGPHAHFGCAVIPDETPEDAHDPE